MDVIEQELEVMLKVDSPYIVSFYEVYYDTKYIHVVMENVNVGCGDLFECLLAC